MASRRARALVGTVALLAVAQIVYEDVLVFLGATGTLDPATAASPSVLVGVPLALFLALSGTLLGWAILTSETLR